MSSVRVLSLASETGRCGLGELSKGNCDMLSVAGLSEGIKGGARCGEEIIHSGANTLGCGLVLRSDGASEAERVSSEPPNRPCPGDERDESNSRIWAVHHRVSPSVTIL